VLHTGNMGKKQRLINLVNCAELTKDQQGLLWVLVGQGEERAYLEQEISRRNLANIRMLPLQPNEALCRMYSSADILILNQAAAIEDAVIPSKLLTYMAAGRPIVAAVSEKSEAARQILLAKCGVVVPAENPRALADAVLSLRQNPTLREELGVNGRSYAEAHFTKALVLRKYDEFFERASPSFENLGRAIRPDATVKELDFHP
jgi:putative colanic acid biosynthesis glycosyltransferase WcaI